MHGHGTRKVGSTAGATVASGRAIGTNESPNGSAHPVRLTRMLSEAEGGYGARTVPSSDLGPPRARGGWLRLFSGRRARPAKPIDPGPVLRSIIIASDGVELSTVELLAEEQGVDAAAVSATLDRWRRDGTVRYERGPDGEEVLAWSNLDDA